MGIPESVRESAKRLLARLDRVGKVADRETLDRLSHHPGATVPNWLIELLSEFPLAGVRVGVKVTDKSAGFVQELIMFELGDSALLEEINTASYPGKYLFPRGYVSLGCGIEWAGDVLLMATTSKDPPVYQVWHDVSHDPEELEQAVLSGTPGTRLISPKLSQLFSDGYAEPPWET